PKGPNILIDLPPAIRNFPAYQASGFDPTSEAAQNILAAGYPPDIVIGPNSLWQNYYLAFWEVTQCQWQKRLDPAYDTYGRGPGTYDSFAGTRASDGAEQSGAFEPPGRIRRPLITVAGTLDGLLPIDRHARAYAAKVAAAQHDHRHQRARAQYRLYE